MCALLNASLHLANQMLKSRQLLAYLSFLVTCPAACPTVRFCSAQQCIHRRVSREIFHAAHRPLFAIAQTLAEQKNASSGGTVQQGGGLQASALPRKSRSTTSLSAT